MQKLVKNNKKPSDREKKECRKWLNSIHNFYELDISIKGNKYQRCLMNKKGMMT